MRHINLIGNQPKYIEIDIYSSMCVHVRNKRLVRHDNTITFWNLDTYIRIGDRWRMLKTDDVVLNLANLQLGSHSYSTRMEQLGMAWHQNVDNNLQELEQRLFIEVFTCMEPYLMGLWAFAFACIWIGSSINWVPS